MKILNTYSQEKRTFSQLKKLTAKAFLAVIFTLGIIGTSTAQNADEYFHNGAQSFIGANLQDAINHVQEGLAQYPDDPKLNALLQKLEEEQEKQQQQQEQNQENQEQQQQDQDQEQEEQEQEPQQSEGENNEQNPQEGESIESQQITKEEAEKILQALAQKEKDLLKEFKKRKKEGSAKHEKDW